MKRLIIAAFNKGANHWVLIVSSIGHIDVCIIHIVYTGN